MCVLSESSFLAASCSYPGVCSTSFLCCHNLWSGFLHGFQLHEIYCLTISVCCCVWLCARAHAGEEVVHGKWHIGLLCCVSDVIFALCAQTAPAPLRSEVDKRRHGVNFPHSDVSACENPITTQLVSSHFEFFSFVLSLALPCLSSGSPKQTLACVIDTCLEGTWSPLLAQAHRRTEQKQSKKKKS